MTPTGRATPKPPRAVTPRPTAHAAHLLRARLAAKAFTLRTARPRRRLSSSVGARTRQLDTHWPPIEPRRESDGRTSACHLRELHVAEAFARDAIVGLGEAHFSDVPAVKEQVPQVVLGCLRVQVADEHTTSLHGLRRGGRGVRALPWRLAGLAEGEDRHALR
eukprot:CAMPEP_0195597428 /NCGR_PEP_ID=MMETSP0815-20121206/2981_1 /TAXON_ID=97485 /ORGANISM="Prymnesium parvum, Strain Texoma1" /LENGTH=162 /DNA_ID=CAMNT_0040736771 /DNA_START=307 /DNA_END=793 /DNA_ORIENTATION=-